MVNNYDVVPLSQSSTRLVGTKVAKRTPEKFRISAAAHRESEEHMDEPDKLTQFGSEKSSVKPIKTPKSDIPKGADGAGLMFGRANLCRRANMVSSWSETCENEPSASERLGRHARCHFVKNFGTFMLKSCLFV